MEDRAPSPSAASLDSQTVPTAVMVHEAVGYDGETHQRVKTLYSS
ncbi:MAG: hypothetical protein N4J56_002902 [Chroococcidiopsis sp. SAG 2025]|nr:hypothetical protein [Chroococcidiopsis sp. SAG 2025]